MVGTAYMIYNHSPRFGNMNVNPRDTDKDNNRIEIVVKLSYSWLKEMLLALIYSLS